jgi:hypothetical protein
MLKIYGQSAGNLHANYIHLYNKNRGDYYGYY